jgi:hypothetical protein
MEGREISQEMAEQRVEPNVRSLESLTAQGLSQENAMHFVEKDKSIVDLWEQVKNTENTGH